MSKPYRYGMNGEDHYLFIGALGACSQKTRLWFLSQFCGEPDALRKRIELCKAQRNVNKHAAEFITQLTTQRLTK